MVQIVRFVMSAAIVCVTSNPGIDLESPIKVGECVAHTWTDEMDNMDERPRFLYKWKLFELLWRHYRP